MNTNQLRNVCMYFLQLAERMEADCRPNIAAFAHRQAAREQRRLIAVQERYCYVR